MIIICDIDDTLLRYGTQPIRSTIDWLNAHKSYTIILITGRPASTRADTVKALRKAGVRYNRLVMNPSSTANSNAFKEAEGRRLAPRVALAIDNNPDARAAYVRAGIRKVIHPNYLASDTLKGIWAGSFTRVV